MPMRQVESTWRADWSRTGVRFRILVKKTGWRRQDGCPGLGWSED